MRTLLRSLPLALAAGAVLAPAAEATPTPPTPPVAKAAATNYPVITSVSPKKLRIGQTLTVRGRYFRAGAGKSSVVFYVKGRPVVFIKAKTATTKKVTVRVTDKVLRLFATSSTKPRMVRLGVVGKKMSKKFTPNKLSVTITPTAQSPSQPQQAKQQPATTGPAAPGMPTKANPTADTTPPAEPTTTCAEKALANPNGDEDGDGLINALETSFQLDPCSPDTDGDGISDAYEYYSAQDLNQTYNTGFIPYPGPRPFPNPLDSSDVGEDFDGDGLLLWQEYKLWRASGGHLPITTYSDGNQRTGGIVPAPVGSQLDLDDDGQLTDDEKDFDDDGLSNMVEFNTTGVPNWWNAMKWTVPAHGSAEGYEKTSETPYAWRVFDERSMLDPTMKDTDKDGIADGMDDQDHDGWNNIEEMQYGRSRGGMRTQPFNPCLPDTHALTCGRYLPMDVTPDNGHPPYDKSFAPGTDYTQVRWPWNNPSPLLVRSNEIWDGTTGPQGPTP